MATLLLTGATGYAGGHVLTRMVAHPGVAKIVSLQRKPLDDNNPNKGNSKLHEVVIPSETAWTDYPADVLDQLKDVSGVVWALGSTKFPTMAITHRVSTDYTMYALSRLLSTSTHLSLNFIYLSGAASIRDQSSFVAVRGDFRKSRGRLENELLASCAVPTPAPWVSPSTAEPTIYTTSTATSTTTRFSPASTGTDCGPSNLGFVGIVRAGFIRDEVVEGQSLMSKVVGAVFSTVAVRDLAAGMVELALQGAKVGGEAGGEGGKEGDGGKAEGGKLGTEGNERARILENDEIKWIGQEVLKREGA